MTVNICKNCKCSRYLSESNDTLLITLSVIQFVFVNHGIERKHTNHFLCLLSEDSRKIQGRGQKSSRK